MPKQTVTKTCGQCLRTWEGIFNGRLPKTCHSCHQRRQRHKDPAKANSYVTKYRLKKKYGLTQERFDEMLRAQSGKCAIGGEPFSKSLTPVVDHCHATGKVRGLLCKNCNTGIGMLKDRPENFIAAFNYIEDHRLGTKS